MLLEFNNLIISNKKGKIPNLPFLDIQKKVINKILNKKYCLSINFIGPLEAQKLNKKYRQQNYIPNILTFPYSDISGEIFICLSVARQQAKDFSLSYHNFLILLIIHGCLHLSKIEHGKEMKEMEEKFLKKILNNVTPSVSLREPASPREATLRRAPGVLLP